MKNFLETNFDKILMAVFAAYMVHTVHAYGTVPETISWSRELTSGFVGALIGLVTGVHVGKAEQKKEDDK